MARIKYDGIIEAVRYTTAGKIDMVRFYERRGAIWSDRIILGRKDLVERLNKGKRFAAGTRKEFLGSSFETGLAVQHIEEHLVTDGQPAKRDLLAGVPTF